MNTADPIIEKVKKLLRLGQSPNQHEAELALQKAFELASQHNIDVATLDLEDELRKIIQKAFPLGNRVSYLRNLVLNILPNFFNVRVVVYGNRFWTGSRVFQSKEIVFIGTASNIEIAAYVYEYLVRAASDGLKRFSIIHPRKLSRNQRDNYLHGFIYGVVKKLNQQKQQLEVTDSNTAIMLAEASRLDQKEREFFPGAKALPRRGITRTNPNAMMAGVQDGSKVQLRPGVNGVPTQTNLLGY